MTGGSKERSARLLELPPPESGQKLTHYLFRFPAKFHPPVVAKLLSEYSAAGDTVYDPFCGSGTALVEARRMGRNAVGLDVDPLAVEIARVKSSRLRPRQLSETAARVLEEVRASAPVQRDYSELQHQDLGDADYELQISPYRRTIPAIPNLEHWFRRYVVVDLAHILSTLQNASLVLSQRAFLEIVFASTIRNASNADPVPVSGLEVTKWMREREEGGRIVDPFALFERALHKAVLGAAEFYEQTSADTTVYVRRGDVTQARPPRSRIDLVLTSPPYHGAVDYYRRHQLEMFWLGMTESQEDRLALLDHYIGRPHVPKRHRWTTAAIPEAGVRRWFDTIQAVSSQRADEFCHYITAMRLALERVARSLSSGQIALFVVGHSDWRGLEIPTTALFEELGSEWFRVEDVLSYPIRNRYMSYERHNAANISDEHVLVMKRR